MFVYAVTQLCPTLVAPCTLPGPSVHRTFLVRILEWVAISSSRGSSPPRSWTCVSCVSCIDRHILYHCAPGNPVRLMGLNYSQVPVAWSLHLCNWNVCVCLLAQSCLTLCSPMEPSRLFCPWTSLGKDTAVSCHFLLQDIFQTQGSNPHLLCLLNRR